MTPAAAPDPTEQVRVLYEDVESETTRVMEGLMGGSSIGRLMALSAENLAAMARIGADACDLVLRNLRIAGRADITRLAKQLYRTEDKLERVLQELEALREEIARPRDTPG